MPDPDLEQEIRRSGERLTEIRIVKTHMTHSTWNRAIKRGLALAATQPERALQFLETLAKNVGTELATSIQDWHLAQTRHMLSLVQTKVGDHRAAADTLRKVAYQHSLDLRYQQRAFVSASAAAALALARSGDSAGARRMLKNAAPAASTLRPKDKLIQHARRLISSRTDSKRRVRKRR